ncbi:MAG TPA: AAA family ATPase, partial [Gaiellaceae bacterium]|nr:AAA family ATPase [Gaiellaceae bacterium]
LAGGIAGSRVDEVLALVDLGAAGRRRVKGYSLGMRQRLGLAAALLGDPEVLVLDEPANGLDPQGIRWLRDFLRSLASEGRTILVSSHVLAEVAQTVDEVVIIDRGKLLRHVAIAEVEALAAGSTTVRSPDAGLLLERLVSAGLGARSVGEGRLEVSASPEHVGEIAASAGIVLHELTAARATLEEVFLELTGEPGERGA